MEKTEDGQRADRVTGKPPRESEVEMMLIALPYDANPRGYVLGGHIMHQIDMVAAMCAVKHARREAVTASMDDLYFHHPIRIGDFIILRARLALVGRSSMDIEVRVLAEAPLTGERTLTTTAYLTFVGLDTYGRPAPVPPLLLETEEDHRRHARAQARRAERMRRLEQRRVEDREE
jgi:acyl-CoA hydrolase